MKQIVIGLGQVGQAVQKVLECDGYDPLGAPGDLPIHVSSQVPPPEQYDVVHICFPYSEAFVEAALEYEKKYAAELVVVHSTVPVGTCDPHGWVHSPIRGVHPDLELGVRTFVKFFGGTKATIAAGLFQEKRVKTATYGRAATTEAIKLWDTTYYGWNILIQKAIAAFCEKHGLPFEDVYTYANATYNEGYALLGRIDVQRPVLKYVPGPIGGHCVRPNWELLEDPIAELSKTLHKELTGE